MAIASAGTLLALTVIGCVTYLMMRNPLLSSREGRSVDRHLHELYDEFGGYEPIRWWPAKDCPDRIQQMELEVRERGLKHAKKRYSEMRSDSEYSDWAARRLVEAEQRLDDLQKSTSLRICRLKYKARNKDGNFMFRDRVFLVTDTEALNLDHDQDFSEGVNKFGHLEFKE